MQNNLVVKAQPSISSSLHSYGQNWGTYNEAAVKAKACNLAAHFVKQFASTHPLLKLHVYPTVDGDIGVEWRDGQREHAVIFSDSGITFVKDVNQECAELLYTNVGQLLKDLKEQL